MITKRDFILHGRCFCEKYNTVNISIQIEQKKKIAKIQHSHMEMILELKTRRSVVKLSKK